MITANSGHDLVPSRIYQFAGWTGDGYIDLLCAVICSGLADHIQPVLPTWACEVLDDYVGVSGCANGLASIWITEHNLKGDAIVYD